jgi:hypothetical protein
MKLNLVFGSPCSFIFCEYLRLLTKAYCMNLTGGELSTALDPLTLYKCLQLSIGADLQEGYNPAFYVE